MRIFQALRHAALAAALSLGAAAAATAAYPDKPVRLVVNFTPAGPLDLLARLVAERASRELGQTVIVENRAGAGGNIGADVVAKSAPDGYTLLITTDTLATVNPFVYASMPADPFKDLQPVALTGTFNQVLVVQPSLGVRNLADYMAYLRQHGGTYASAGNATPGHLTFESLRQALDLDVTHVPYRGTAPAVNDLLGGQVEAGFLVVPGVLQHIQAGKLVPLAVSGAQRDAALPDVPTIAESGLAQVRDFDTSFGYLLMAPAGVPDEAVQAWQRVLARIYASPEFLERLAALDIAPTFSDAQQAAQWMRTRAARWEKVVAAAGIKP
ncbi:tripartite tricarboxylate transporter substrate binding protein [Bordetella bronchiseptica]